MKTKPRYDHFDLKQRLALRDKDRAFHVNRRIDEVSDVAFYSCLVAVLIAGHLLFLAAVFFSERYLMD